MGKRGFHSSLYITFKYSSDLKKEELLMSKEKEEENMWDIVDLDDEAIEEYASNELLGQFLSNTVFRTGILCVILFNSILIAVETDQELVSNL